LTLIAAAVLPAAIVTAGVGLAAIVGGVQLFSSVYMNGVNGNYDGLAYNIGSIVGGFSVGGFMSGAIRYAITGEAGGGYSVAQDAANRYDSSYTNPDGSPGSFYQALGKGPDPVSGGAAAGSSGTGQASPIPPKKCGC
jgi:hypothetical protein